MPKATLSKWNVDLEGINRTDKNTTSKHEQYIPALGRKYVSQENCPFLKHQFF